MLFSLFVNFLVFLILLCCYAVLVECQASNVLPLYSQQQTTGQGTYYGYKSGGACTLDTLTTANNLPSWVAQSVAITQVQWFGSSTCGMCISLTPLTGTPITTPLVVFVNDLCPSCPTIGSLDFGQTVGGVWPISWIAVPCPVTTPISYFFQGSNAYYIKIQVRWTPLPVDSISVNGLTTTRTTDNFFVFSFGSPVTTLSVKTTLIDGQTYTENVNWISNGEVPSPTNFQFIIRNPATGTTPTATAAAVTSTMMTAAPSTTMMTPTMMTSMMSTTMMMTSATTSLGPVGSVGVTSQMASTMVGTNMASIVSIASRTASAVVSTPAVSVMPAVASYALSISRVVKN